MSQVMAGLGNDATRTKGRKALEKLLSRVSQSGVAAVCGVSQVAVCKWAQGANRPAELHRRRLQRAYGIPSTDWMTRYEFAAFEEAG